MSVLESETHYKAEDLPQKKAPSPVKHHLLIEFENFPKMIEEFLTTAKADNASNITFIFKLSYDGVNFDLVKSSKNRTTSVMPVVRDFLDVIDYMPERATNRNLDNFFTTTKLNLSSVALTVDKVLSRFEFTTTAPTTAIEYIDVNDICAIIETPVANYTYSMNKSSENAIYLSVGGLEYLYSPFWKTVQEILSEKVALSVYKLKVKHVTKNSAGKVLSSNAKLGQVLKYRFDQSKVGLSKSDHINIHRQVKWLVEYTGSNYVSPRGLTFSTFVESTTARNHPLSKQMANLLQQEITFSDLGCNPVSPIYDREGVYHKPENAVPDGLKDSAAKKSRFVELQYVAVKNNAAI